MSIIEMLTIIGHRLAYGLGIVSYGAGVGVAASANVGVAGAVTLKAKRYPRHPYRLHPPMPATEPCRMLADD
jgi:hypothetical protein